MGWREITPPRFHIGSEAAEVQRFRENVEKMISSYMSKLEVIISAKEKDLMSI